MASGVVSSALVRLLQESSGGGSEAASDEPSAVPTPAPTAKPNAFNSNSSGEWSEVWTTVELNVFMLGVLLVIFWWQRKRTSVYGARRASSVRRLFGKAYSGQTTIGREPRTRRARHL